MFDLPNAKRVRRSDLYTRSQSPSPTPSEPDPELEAQFRARLASIYGPASDSIPVSIPGALNRPSNVNGDAGTAEDEPEQEFEFRLFSTTVPGKSGNEDDVRAQKVILIDEEEEIGGGGFVVRERNRGYYFSQKAGGERRQGFEVMALSGEDVLSRARKRAWGLEVPWRVQVLKVAGKQAGGKTSGAADALVVVEDETDRKKKPGKKRRIILRERKRAREKLQEQKKAEKEKKEEAEREKRTRRNREKKVKRKMKEKAKKVGGGGTADGVGDGAAEPGEPPDVGTD